MYVVTIHIKANCQLHKNDIKSFELYGNFCATMSRRQDSMHKYANTVPFLKVFACLSVPVFVLHRKREKFLKKPLNFTRHTMHGSFKYRVVTIFKRSPCVSYQIRAIHLHAHHLTHSINSLFLFM